MRNIMTTLDEIIAPTTDDHGIAIEVPDELWLSVLVGQLDEDTAIERGRRAVQARTEDERRSILFGASVHDIRSRDARRPMPLPPGPMPWFEP
jgi:hypothetical protein